MAARERETVSDVGENAMVTLVTTHRVIVMQQKGTNAMVACDKCGAHTLAAWENVTERHEGLPCYGECGRYYAIATSGELVVREDSSLSAVP